MEKVFLIYAETSYLGVAGTTRTVFGKIAYRTEDRADNAIFEHMDELNNSGWKPFFNEKDQHNIAIDSDGKTKVEFSVEGYTMEDEEETEK